MSRVRAAFKVFAVEDYEDNPVAFSHCLARAKAEDGHATCLCTSGKLKLVIRRVASPSGDRFFLATWPNTGGDHDPECRFHHTDDEYGSPRTERLDAVVITPEGFSLKADFSMVRMTGSSTDPKGIAPDPVQGKSRTQRSALGLLATLEYFWQSAGLHRWLASYPRAHPKRWSNLVTRLQSVLQQGKLGKRRLVDVTYVVPAYQPEQQEAINARLDQMIEAHCPTSTTVPSFMIIGELTQVAQAGKALRLQLKHQKRPLWLFPSLGERLGKSYPAAEAILSSPINDPYREGRVVGLFMVEVTSQGGLWVKDAALMACSKEYIPCDSSYEIRVANLLTQHGRSFIKPLKIETEGHLLPDFKLLDCGVPTVMEVWGMATAEYIAQRAEKIERYKGLGVSLWQWDAIHEPLIPPLPTKRVQAGTV